MSNPHKFLTLDALRGIAALLIVTRHTTGYYHSYLAVDLFFILSGFVISHAYDKKLISKSMSFWRFFLTRIIRLYPLYILATIISALVIFPRKALIGGETDVFYQYVTSVIFALLYLPYKYSENDSLFPINGVSWSLFFELIINIIYAISRPVISNITLMVVVLFSGIYLATQSILLGGIDYGYLWDLQSISIGSARTIFGFSCGLLLYRAHLKQPNVRESTAKSILLLFLASIPLALVKINKLDGVIDCISVFIVFPYCILLGAKTNPNKRSLSIFEIMGIISYPIYLLHYSVGSGLSKSLKFIGYDVEHFAPYSGCILVAGLVAISLLLDHFYDRPVRRYLSAIAFTWQRTELLDVQSQLNPKK